MKAKTITIFRVEIPPITGSIHQSDHPTMPKALRALASEEAKCDVKGQVERISTHSSVTFRQVVWPTVQQTRSIMH